MFVRERELLPGLGEANRQILDRRQRPVVFSQALIDRAAAL